MKRFLLVTAGTLLLAGNAAAQDALVTYVKAGKLIDPRARRE